MSLQAFKVETGNRKQKRELESVMSSELSFLWREPY